MVESLVAQGSPFDPQAPARSHAVLVDIDHTPCHPLHPSHAPFYEPDGIRRLAGRLHPGGVFALWSDGPPDDAYVAAVGQVVESCAAHVATFPNPLTGDKGSSTVYVATRRG